MVQDSADLLSDPQLAHRGHWETLQPRASRRAVASSARAIRFSGSEPAPHRAPAPNLGEHTRSGAERPAGLSAAEIARLRESGVVA